MLCLLIITLLETTVLINSMCMYTDLGVSFSHHSEKRVNKYCSENLAVFHRIFSLHRVGISPYSSQQLSTFANFHCTSCVSSILVSQNQHCAKVYIVYVNRAVAGGFTIWCVLGIYRVHGSFFIIPCAEYPR